MISSKTLRRPNNWQDFETLCKKLWGEIWNCPEIKKNGRSGQNQHGVDVYGVPHSETGYYGIQCKGKDEYTHKQLTEFEIDTEIANAKRFEPPLKKLYFATTAVKDAVIEKYIRQKNLEHKAAGLFEVHLFSWEDIVELIDENKQTHNWYVNNQNYKARKSVMINFHTGSSELSVEPKFKQVVTEYGQRIMSANPYDDPLTFFSGQVSRPNSFIFPVPPSYKPRVNLSYIGIGIVIRNTGSEIIENFQLNLEFDGNIVDADYSNEQGGIAYIPGAHSHLSITTSPVEIKIHPKNESLVSEAVYRSETFFIKPSPDKQKIKINWTFLSKDFKDKGELVLDSNPHIETKSKTVLLDITHRKPAETGPIEDFYSEE